MLSIIFIQASSHSGQGLSPAEVLIAIHAIDPDRDAIPLKKVGLSCVCLSSFSPRLQRNAFSPF